MAPLARYVALVLACFFLVLAIAGVVLPGVPTVPFLLLAAWFAARGSDRLHRWLLGHPRFGRMLADWETQKAISRRAKVVAVLMMAVSWGVLYWRLGSTWGLLAITLVLTAAAAYVVSRPEPR
jgi:uncharacterized membrane protein YbaN (DUF454 family)